MRKNLKLSLELVFGHEGGYVNAKTDRGGPTKWGITIATLSTWQGRPATIDEVKNLSIHKAAQIYQSMYWAQSGGDVLPSGIDYMTFDFGLNSGVSRGTMNLQKTLKAAGVYKGEIDGHIGPQTLAAIKIYPGGLTQLAHDYADMRMAYLRSITNRKTGWPVNGRGWTIRVTGKDPKGQWKPQPGVLGNALKMIAREPIEVVPEHQAQYNVTHGIDSQRPADPGVVSVLKSPELIAGGTTIGTGLLGLAANSPVIQIAVAALLFVGVGILGYTILRRMRNAPVAA